ncbi:thiol-disulfide oxidoreductase DCC family protein [Bacillus sp. REN10]|uniref:thiol-disulfide oxidoreductase DCC family protein n=1 Tax=Bacillus sp. REN10 TaxID=2782541 RepID=UPI00193BE4E1|nr:thiol-disulfide oxidoreductase DCC family protein [Bacillus sp. REN10]
MNKVVLFDGECNFCDHSVQFIIKRDPNAYYKFASLQSEAGKQLVAAYKVPSNIDSLLLIDDKHCYHQSTAALRICKHLSGGWKLFYYLLIIPRPIRDRVYRWIAKNRYKWFGKKDHCIMPSPDIRDRFL